MERISFVLKVKEGMIEEYKAHHREVWPEMLDALREAGWHNYSLFMKRDGTLFGYFETPDSLQAAVERMEQREVNERWQTMMVPFFDSREGAYADEMMVELEEVFHLD